MPAVATPLVLNVQKPTSGSAPKAWWKALIAAATAGSFTGVERSYAVQAGRELRVIVENAKISEEAAFVLARDVAKKIEGELTYPGQIKVTVIRETRAVEYAR